MVTSVTKENTASQESAGSMISTSALILFLAVGMHLLNAVATLARLIEIASMINALMANARFMNTTRTHLDLIAAWIVGRKEVSAMDRFAV